MYCMLPAHFVYGDGHFYANLVKMTKFCVVGIKGLIWYRPPPPPPHGGE